MEVDGLEAGLDADAERITGHRPEEQAPARCAGPTPTPSGCCCGSRASRRSAPSAGWRRATARRTASCRARSCRTSCARSSRIGEKYDIEICNVFHAGDGNIHPILLFDERDADQVRRVLAASHEILDECIRVRRQRDRRARHRRGEDRLHAEAVHAGRPGDDGAAARRRSTRTTGAARAKMLPTAGACIEPSKAGRRAAL